MSYYPFLKIKTSSLQVLIEEIECLNALLCAMSNVERDSSDNNFDTKNKGSTLLWNDNVVALVITNFEEKSVSNVES